MTTFKELGLNTEIMKGLDDLGFVEPSGVQAEAIPFILKSKEDLTALAQTGTGKTAAYSLPILNQIKEGEKDLQAIILCPTRELALQIYQDIKKYTKYQKSISATAVYGGERIDLQIRALKRGTNIVVGTPGRVHDLIRRNVLKLQSIKWLVLDEADEMLDMGFKDDLDAVLSQTPDTRQTLLFSATMSKSVANIAKNYMKDTHEISIGEKNMGADKVSHEYYVVQARDRFETLKRVLDYIPGIYGIVFCRTRRETQEVANKLKAAHYDADALHGEITQVMRTKIMDSFKKKRIRLLIATDVAARGIDVNDLSHVINYNLPDHNESYTHRSGRTGRAQKSGVSVSIITSKEVGRIRRIESIIGKKFEYKKVPTGKDVCKKQIDSFVKEIEAVNIEEFNDDEYFTEIVDKLKKLKKEDLIKYFITHKFSDLMNSNKATRDLNSNASVNDSKRPFDANRDGVDGSGLKINLGKKDGFGVKEFFALINSDRRLKGVEVGKISIMSEFSSFSVEKKRENDVLRALKGSSFKGKKIDVSMSGGGGGRSSYGGSRSGGRSSRGGSSGGGYKGRGNSSNRKFDKNKSGGSKRYGNSGGGRKYSR